MKTTLTVLTTLGLAATVATSAWAFRSDSESFGERLAALGVTDAQKQQVRSILRQHQPAAGPLIKRLVEERRKLRDTIRADQIDEKAIRAQAAKVAGLEADLAVERARVVHAIKPVLTPEQLTKLKTMQVDVDERVDGFLSRVAKRIAAD
jgi:Spy/CpxP family protein refolding chaperone